VAWSKTKSKKGCVSLRAEKKVQSIIGFEHLSLDHVFFPEVGQEIPLSSAAVSLLESAKDAEVPVHDRDALYGRRKTVSDAISLYFDVRSNPGYKSLQLENLRQLLRAALEAPRDDKSRQTMLKLHELSLTTVLLTYNTHALVSGRKGPTTVPCKFWDEDNRLTVQFCLFEDFDVNLEQDGAYFYLTFTKHPMDRLLVHTLRSTMSQPTSISTLTSPSIPILSSDENSPPSPSSDVNSDANSQIPGMYANPSLSSSSSSISPILPFSMISTQSTNPSLDARIHNITSQRPKGHFFNSPNPEKVDYLVTVPMEYSLDVGDIFWQKTPNDFTISFEKKFQNIRRKLF